jgi:uncharacterized protein YidB (DUF937 family)
MGLMDQFGQAVGGANHGRTERSASASASRDGLLGKDSGIGGGLLGLFQAFQKNGLGELVGEHGAEFAGDVKLD